MTLLFVRDLSISLVSTGRPLLQDVSFSIDRGDRLGLIGESGSGKSILALSLLGLLSADMRASGSVRLSGTEVVGGREEDLRRLRGTAAAMVFQEPLASLDPLMRVGRQIMGPLRLHRGMRGEAARRAASDLLDRVRLPDRRRIAASFPHELSGGQRQRVAIAMALACRPALLIADEPTTALDVTVQAEILSLLDELVSEEGMALLFITHDLPVISRIAYRMLVLEAGKARRKRYDRGDPFLSASPHHRPPARGRAAGDDSTIRAGRVAMNQPAAGVVTVPSSAVPVFEAEQLGKSYRGRRGDVRALDSVTMQLVAGRNLGVVGESGAGKSTLLGILLALERPSVGSVRFRGEPLDPANRTQMARLRREVQVVFQDPRTSLDPRMRVGSIIAEPLRALRIVGDHRAIVASVLSSVGLDPRVATRYPREFSGGQRQRIAIARALAPSPRVLVADEPVSSLDVSVRSQILDLLVSLRERLGLTLLLVSHDLAVVGHLCDDILILRAGRVVESGPAAEIFRAPRTEYAARLLDSVPTLPPAARAGRPST